MINKFPVLIPVWLILVTITGCSGTKPQISVDTKKTTNSIVKAVPIKKQQVVPVVLEKRISPKQSPTHIKKPFYRQANNNSFAEKLSDAALDRLRHKVRYDGKYVKIGYPWGDVPQDIGVCTDVVIRSYRKLGIDLQSQVHEDMKRAFHTYPNLKKWGLAKPDTNIDHRRVYNLRNFFHRKGAALPITNNPRNYKPGDLVTWLVGKDLPHIGVVVNQRSKSDPNRFMIVHNIAHGPQIEDILFRFPITGHYRYTPAHIGEITQNKYVVSNQYASVKNDSMTIEQLNRAAAILLSASTPSDYK